MPQELIKTINGLLSRYKPSDLRKLKILLNGVDKDANDHVKWDLLEFKLSHKLQSAFMKCTCSAEEFQEWIKIMKGSDYIKEREQKADETTQESEYWRERMRAQWVEHEPMKRHQPREELCEK